MLAAFDTHTAVKRLIVKGFKEEQAEEVIKIFTESQEHIRAKEEASTKQVTLLEKDVESLKGNAEALQNTVATKADLQLEGVAIRSELKAEGVAIRSELKAEGVAIRSELKVDIASVENKVVAVENKLLLAMEKNTNKLLVWFGGGIIATITIIPIIIHLLKIITNYYKI